MADVPDLVAGLIEARGKGMAARVRAADVHQAIAVARALQDRTGPHWFRGQVRSYPQLSSSFHRLPEADREGAMQRLSLFSHWVKSTPGLERLAESYDAMIAVAQHHGLPTTFLDFTTSPEIAGFFASHATGPVDPETESCIFCLHLEEADKIWSSVASALGPEHAVERLVLDVPNLWRLEAQKGAFVWSIYADLNTPFPLDRIVFPYRGPVATPTVEQIYPTRESPLEAQMREYFQNEAIDRGSRLMKEIIPSLLATTITTEGEDYLAQHFVATPTPHPSWEHVQPWLDIRREWASALAGARTLAFTVEPTESPHDAAARLEQKIAAWLAAEPDLRRIPVTWNVTAPDRPASVVDDVPSLAETNWLELGLSAPVQHIWNEMVRLPWSDAAVATALAGAIRWRLAAEALSTRPMGSRERERETAEALLESPIRVEIGGWNNAHNWAWLDEWALLAAVRDDFPALIRPEDHERILGDSFNTLMVARKPSLLFDFDRLAALFASTMIPTQAVFNPELPLFASPARPEVIGPE